MSAEPTPHRCYCAGQGRADSKASQRSGLHQLQQEWLQQRRTGRTGLVPASEPPVGAHGGGQVERASAFEGALAKIAPGPTAGLPEGSPSEQAGWAASAPDTNATAAAGAAAQLPGAPPGNDEESAFQLDIDFGPETQLPAGHLAAREVMDPAAQQQQHGLAACPSGPEAAAPHLPGSSLTAPSAERPATTQQQNQQHGLTDHQGHAAEAAAAPGGQAGSHSAAAGEGLPTGGAEACAGSGCLQVGQLCSW